MTLDLPEPFSPMKTVTPLSKLISLFLCERKLPNSTEVIVCAHPL